VADLLGRMTIEEKVAQMGCWWHRTERDAEPPEMIGQIFRAASDFGATPREYARRINELQRRTIESSRFGIPVIFCDEAEYGLSTRGATMFPVALSQASTWDLELIGRVGETIGRQMQAIGVRRVFSPLCDVAHDVRWGRIEETYGEDAYLVGSMAAAFVAGMQGPDPALGTMASLKHFVAYGASEGGRNTHPAHVGPRAMREVHGLPFEMTIRLGGARGIMCSYQQVDSVPVQASRELLTDLLRHEYGFTGSVISDLDSAARLVTRHRVAETLEDAAVLALNAGMDCEITPVAYAQPLIDAVQHGRADMADVDRAAGKILEWKFKLGLFESPFVEQGAVPEALETSEDRSIARQVAERSITLLQNNPVDGAPILPLPIPKKRIAVIGPNADRPASQIGDYSYPIFRASARRIRRYVELIRSGNPPSRSEAWMTPDGEDIMADSETVPVVTVLEGIRQRAGADFTVTYARGCLVQDETTDLIEEAVAKARDADVAVVVVGDQSGVVLAATVGEGVDGATLALPGIQRRLVEEIVATGTPVVVVLLNGRPFVLDWMAGQVPAIVEAWFPGEEGGNAIAAVLFGDVNPSGRLPVSFRKSAGIEPSPYTRARQFDSNYYDATIEPLYGFGHGLSYTTFEYSELVISPDSIPADGELKISCVVRNTGDRDADEVVQLYLSDLVARTARPPRELKGFCRVSIPKGASVRVEFNLPATRTALYDPAEGWVVEAGHVEVLVGASSEDIRLQGEFTISDTKVIDGKTRALVTLTATIRI
jgi:beta-glucosidase